MVDNDPAGAHPAPVRLSLLCCNGCNGSCGAFRGWQGACVCVSQACVWVILAVGASMPFAAWRQVCGGLCVSLHQEVRVVLLRRCVPCVWAFE